jgi:hypothetical protein
VRAKRRDAGFARPELVFYWSRPLGYLGREQVLCIARKPVSAAPATSTDPNGSLP